MRVVCVCGAPVGWWRLLTLFLLQWYEGEKCTRSAIEHSLMNPWWIACVCMCVRNVIVVAAAPQSLMHNRNAVQVHHTWTTSRTETAVCFALYCLRFAVSFHTISAPWVLVPCHSRHAKLIAKVPNAMKLSQCKDRFASIDSPDFTL